MLCEECGQNSATITITVLANGENKSKHLCEACMARLKSDFAKGDIQHFLSSILTAITAQKPEAPALTCSRCGLSFSDFQRTGKLGCAQCYHDFEAPLKPMLLRIHGRSQHSGRIPKADDQDIQQDRLMADLRSRMDAAIEKEDFEEAAYIRDQIRALSQNHG